MSRFACKCEICEFCEKSQKTQNTEKLEKTSSPQEFRFLQKIAEHWKAGEDKYPTRVAIFAILTNFAKIVNFAKNRRTLKS